MHFVYNRNNDAGGGCHDDDQGLTDFGRALLAEAGRMDVLVDLSHLGFRSSMEIIERTRAPVVYSHANPKALAEHPRNVTDEHMRACVATGGLVAVTGIGRFFGDPDATSATLVQAIELTVERVGVVNVGIGLDYSWATGSSGLRDPLFWPRGPRPLSDRRRAPHLAGEPLLERDRRAAPSRCLAARARARRRAGRPASMRRGDHLPRVRAPQR